MADEPAGDSLITPEELKWLRSLRKGFSGAEWRALKALAKGLVAASIGGSGSANGTARPVTSDELSDSFLSSQPWADKRAKKDPKRWLGASYVGAPYSRIPSEWHTVAADAREYKAMKGREQNPPRLQTSGKNAGKPWHEADAFDAKIHRAWARRNEGKTFDPPPPVAPVDDGMGGETGPVGTMPTDDSEWVP